MKAEITNVSQRIPQPIHYLYFDTMSIILSLKLAEKSCTENLKFSPFKIHKLVRGSCDRPCLALNVLNRNKAF